MKSGRSGYQKEMDQVHLSEDKAAETLRAMLAENDAIREKERKKAARRLPPLRRWLPAACAVAAACLVLLFTGVFRPETNYLFGGVSVRKLPVSGVRGEENTPAGPEREEAEKLFPGWTPGEARPGRSLRGLSPDGAELDLTLRKGGVSLDAAVMKGKPVLADALAETGAYGPRGVRFNHDPDTGVLSAVYERDGCYVVLSAEGMEEKEFAKAVMEAAGK